MASNVVRWSAGGEQYVVVKAVPEAKEANDRYKGLVKQGKAVLTAIYFDKRGIKVAQQYKLTGEE